jgi:hypothetical protein
MSFLSLQPKYSRVVVSAYPTANLQKTLLPIMAHTLLASSQRANRHLEDLSPPPHLQGLLVVRLRRPLDLLLPDALPQHHHLQDYRHREGMPGCQQRPNLRVVERRICEIRKSNISDG